MTIQLTQTDFKYCPFCGSESEHVIQTDANSDKYCPVCKRFTVSGKKWASHSVKDMPDTVFVRPIKCDKCELPMVASYDRNGKRYCHDCRPIDPNMKITIWQRYDEKLCKFVHNHIEDGVNLNPRPTPKSEAQQVWRSWRWRKYHGRLINQIVHTHFKL